LSSNDKIQSKVIKLHYTISKFLRHFFCGPYKAESFSKYLCHFSSLLKLQFAIAFVLIFSPFGNAGTATDSSILVSKALFS